MLGRSLRRAGFATATRARGMCTAALQAHPRAALCIIGDEILSGKIQDVNTHVLAQRLFKQGVDLKRVVVVPDGIDEIGATVLDLSARVGPSGFVFTSGGIGSTHDDVTYEAIAKAFNRTLELHQPTLEAMTASMASRGQAMNDARRRMAILPTPCETLPTPGLWVPLCVVENVYILPGIPRLFERMVDANLHRFQGTPIHRRVFATNVAEGDISDPLRAVAGEFPDLSIGSYPQMPSKDEATGLLVHETVVTVDARDPQRLELVTAQLLQRIANLRERAPR